MTEPQSTPRWRGFNLTSMFLRPGDHRFRDMFPWEPSGFREMDFQWISDWGFNCVRLPLCWKIWSSEERPSEINEREIEKIDRAMAYGERYRLHVVLNLHDAPGFCVCAGATPGFDLWNDQRAQDAFITQWTYFAARYRHIPAERLTFNLVNEPSNCTREEHAQVMRATISEIRRIDPTRPIAIDGYGGGGETCPELQDLHITECCRGYLPIEISHHQAWWISQMKNYFPLTWPIYLEDWSQLVNRDSLRNVLTDTGFIPLARTGAPVQCGEFGAYNRAPHQVVLDWMQDYLTIFKEEHIGFLLWNFRGAVGIMDSDRADVDYEPWYGHQLDRRMLALMQSM